MWDPAQYERFKAERAQPLFDLAALVTAGARATKRHVVDLGCGTGEHTAWLHAELAATTTLGIDTSAEMLARAPTAPGLSFERVDVVSFVERARSAGERFDLVFSNAALNWVADHRALFASFGSILAPNGELAVQMPANFHHPSHRVAAEIATEEPFASALGGYRRAPPVLTPVEYAVLLADLGYSEQRVRLEVYTHRLPGARAVAEWVKGTLLTDYRSRMDPALYERFLARYTETLVAELGDASPYVYPFERILLWARR